MIRIVAWEGPEAEGRELEREALPAALARPEGVVWVDIVDEPRAVSEAILSDVFGFHPLAVDDAINEVHLPKVDNWEDYLYMVVRGVVVDETGRITMPELDIFLGANYLVTYHYNEMGIMDRVRESFRPGTTGARHGAAFLLYRMLDEIVNDYMHVVDGLEDRLEHLEDQIFERPHLSVQEQILALRRSVLRLRRVVALQRAAFNKLAREAYTMLTAEEQMFFRDVYDHMLRLNDLCDTLHDLITGALDLYFSTLNQRLNNVMKTLTVFTALFMPITFVTGFFGMNFFEPVLGLDEWTGRIAFVLMLLVVAFVPFTMFMWMRNRDWT